MEYDWPVSLPGRRFCRSRWSEYWKECGRQRRQHVVGQEDRHELVQIVIQVEEKLCQRDWIFLLIAK